MASQVAMVTGAAAGIGLELALALGLSGYRLAICDLPHHLPRATQDRFDEADCSILYRSVDVGQSANVKQFHAELAEFFGEPASVVVNNAGTQTWAHLLDLREEDWDRVIRTNLTGAFLNIQAAARAMVLAGKPGSIISIGSGCNQHAFPRLVDYAASKGGLEMLTKSAAIELGSYGIRVNCIAPGGILTARTLRETDNYAEEWAAIAPLRRVGLPRDIADALLFLASEAASFVTGQTLFVDGGVFAKANWPYAEEPQAALFGREIKG